MSHGLFIAGTGAQVGKTIVAGAMAAALHRRGMKVGVMKPVETGCPLDIASGVPCLFDGMPEPLNASDLASLSRLAEIAGPPPLTTFARTPRESLRPSDALYLMRMASFMADLDLVNPYRFASAAEPAVVSRLAETEVSLDHILSCYRNLTHLSDIILVEGSGGLLDPLTPHKLQVDLLAELALPVLIVARSAPGTINHSLLTAEALNTRGIPFAGFVLKRFSSDARPEEAAHPYQIERFAGPKVHGILPYFEPQQLADADFLAGRLVVHVDLEAILEHV